MRHPLMKIVINFGLLHFIAIGLSFLLKVVFILLGEFPLSCMFYFMMTSFPL